MRKKIEIDLWLLILLILIMFLLAFVAYHNGYARGRLQEQERQILKNL